MSRLAGVSWRGRGSSLGQCFLSLWYCNSKGVDDVLIVSGTVGGWKVFWKDQRSRLQVLLELSSRISKIEIQPQRCRVLWARWSCRVCKAVGGKNPAAPKGGHPDGSAKNYVRSMEVLEIQICFPSNPMGLGSFWKDSQYCLVLIVMTTLNLSP